MPYGVNALKPHPCPSVPSLHVQKSRKLSQTLPRLWRSRDTTFVKLQKCSSLVSFAYYRLSACRIVIVDMDRVLSNTVSIPPDFWIILIVLKYALDLLNVTESIRRRIVLGSHDEILYCWTVVPNPFSTSSLTVCSWISVFYMERLPIWPPQRSMTAKVW